MRSIQVMTLVLALSACARGPSLETRTFELKYLDRERVEALVVPYVYVDRDKAPGGLRMAGNILTVRETPDNLEQIARVLAEYDRVRPPVQLRFQIIHADGAGAPDPAIADVETALRSLFRFRGYRLVADAVVGGLEGSHVEQTVSGEGGPYLIQADIEELRGSGDSTTVRLRVAFRAFTTGGALETTVRVRAGQTVVLGNAGAPSNRGTVILTVRPELGGS
ncbi:MAG TPA: hypothetical protein VGA42_03000 [Gemmatimonadales bacterium]